MASRCSDWPPDVQIGLQTLRFASRGSDWFPDVEICSQTFRLAGRRLDLLPEGQCGLASLVWLAGQASVVTLAWLGCGGMAGVALLSEANKHDINSFPVSWTGFCPAFSLPGQSFVHYTDGCLGHGGRLNLRKISIKNLRKIFFE